MVAASGAAGAGAAATAGMPVAAQEDEDDASEENGGDENGENGNGEDENGENGEAAGGGTETVIVGPGGDNVYEPETLQIDPGTTVEFIWESDNHNVNPTEQPDDADWAGHEPLEDDGFEFSSTFEVEGEYEYVCDPHIGVGMIGEIIVGGDDGAAGAPEVDIDELGIPIQKHFVGVATFLAIFVSFVFTFYLLKYGESAHTSSPGRDK